MGEQAKRFFKEMRNAGMPRPELESLSKRLFPTSPDGTQWVLKVGNDGTVFAERDED